MTNNESLPAEINICLSEIVGEVDSDLIGAAYPCEDTDAGQIVERFRGRLYIVDGFHRTGGQVKYCRENGIDMANHKITVVLACENDDDDELVADAAEPGAKQARAIAEIYRLAGRN